MTANELDALNLLADAAVLYTKAPEFNSDSDPSLSSSANEKSVVKTLGTIEKTSQNAAKPIATVPNLYSSCSPANIITVMPGLRASTGGHFVPTLHPTSVFQPHARQHEHKEINLTPSRSLDVSLEKDICNLQHVIVSPARQKVPAFQCIPVPTTFRKSSTSSTIPLLSSNTQNARVVVDQVNDSDVEDNLNLDVLSLIQSSLDSDNRAPQSVWPVVEDTTDTSMGNTPSAGSDIQSAIELPDEEALKQISEDIDNFLSTLSPEKQSSLLQNILDSPKKRPILTSQTSSTEQAVMSNDDKAVALSPNTAVNKFKSESNPTSTDIQAGGCSSVSGSVDCPTFGSVEMYWNTFPTLRLKGSNYIRLVDIHKQALPGVDTSSMRRRCERLKLPVLKCTEAQCELLIRCNYATPSKSRFMVSEPVARSLIRSFVGDEASTDKKLLDKPVQLFACAASQEFGSQFEREQQIYMKLHERTRTRDKRKIDYSRLASEGEITDGSEKATSPEDTTDSSQPSKRRRPSTCQKKVSKPTPTAASASSKKRKPSSSAAPTTTITLFSVSAPSSVQHSPVESAPPPIEPTSGVTTSDTPSTSAYGVPITDHPGQSGFRVIECDMVFQLAKELAYDAPESLEQFSSSKCSHEDCWSVRCVITHELKGIHFSSQSPPYADHVYSFGDWAHEVQRFRDYLHDRLTNHNRETHAVLGKLKLDWIFDVLKTNKSNKGRVAAQGKDLNGNFTSKTLKQKLNQRRHASTSAAHKKIGLKPKNRKPNKQGKYDKMRAVDLATKLRKKRERKRLKANSPVKNTASKKLDLSVPLSVLNAASGDSGDLFLSKYVSAASLCIRCLLCQAFFSVGGFIEHRHAAREKLNFESNNSVCSDEVDVMTECEAPLALHPPTPACVSPNFELKLASEKPTSSENKLWKYFLGVKRRFKVPTSSLTVSQDTSQDLKIKRNFLPTLYDADKQLQFCRNLLFSSAHNLPFRIKNQFDSQLESITAKYGLDNLSETEMIKRLLKNYPEFRQSNAVISRNDRVIALKL